MSCRTSIVAVRVGATALLVLLQALAPVEDVSAQDMSVLIPDLAPIAGAETRFGDRTARELRSIMDDEPGYQAMDRRELRRTLDAFDIEMEALWDGCVSPLQMGQQIGSDIVFCGEYRAEADEDYLTVSGAFHAVGGEAELEIPSETFYRRDREDAARHIFSEFRTLADALRQEEFCGQDYRGGNYDEAVQSCTAALAANPESSPALWARGRSHMELENWAEAYQDFQTMLERDPDHVNALEHAGYMAMALERSEEARQYYGRYLDLQPGDSRLRMRMAHDLAVEGDVLGALSLIEDGLEVDPDNMDLWERRGTYAFRAATDLRREFEDAEGEDSPLPEDVASLYMDAVEAFNRVLDARGEEVAASDVRNTVHAYIELDRYEEAVLQAEMGLETHDEDPRLWNAYATALHRSGQLSDAVEAMVRVDALDPERESVSNVSMRKGRWLMEEGRSKDALEALERAVELSEQGEEAVANEIFREGYQQGFQKEDWEYARDMFTAALEFEAEPMFLEQVQFFQAFSLFEMAMEVASPETLESAEASLPMFREARDRMADTEDWARQSEGVDLASLLENVDTFIEIQEAIIEREGGR